MTINVGQDAPPSKWVVNMIGEGGEKIQSWHGDLLVPSNGQLVQTLQFNAPVVSRPTFMHVEISITSPDGQTRYSTASEGLKLRVYPAGMTPDDDGLFKYGQIVLALLPIWAVLGGFGSAYAWFRWKGP